MKELEVNKQLPVITANFDEVKESLNQSLEKYKGIIVTEETLQDCKKTQQDLSKVKNGIETFRKSIKKDMEVPIKEFEAKCKELVSLIGEVEQPIKDGITVFDNKRREEKKKQAEEIIKECILSLSLTEKYSMQLTILDKYLNLSASKKSVIEDIKARAEVFKQQQDAEQREIDNLKASIDVYVNTANEDINTKLNSEDFYKYINSGWNIAQITGIIKNQHDKIKEAENPKPVERYKEEIKPIEQPKQEECLSRDIKQAIKEEKKYFYTLKVVADKEHMLKLKNLIQEPGFKYETIDKGIVNK